MKIIRKAFLISLMATALTACGGGGGGDGGGGFVDTSQPISLSSGNAPGVTGVVADAALSGVTVGTLGTTITTSGANADVTSPDFNLVRFAQRDVLDRILAMDLQGALVPAGVGAMQVPPSMACGGGGMINMTWHDRDTNMDLSVGDGIDMSFVNCVEDDLTLNGPVMLGVLSLMGDLSTPPWTVGFRLNFDNLTASADGSSALIVGTFDTTVNAQASGTVTDVTTELATGSGTSSSFLNFGEGDDFTELTLYTIHLEEDSGGGFVLSGQGKVKSTYIAGHVTFTTTEDVTGMNFGANNPSDGNVFIEGANSSVLLRVQDNVHVALDVDNDGDGASDVTIASTWDEISAAADAL